MNENINTEGLNAIDGSLQMNHPTLKALNSEADKIQAFISTPACLSDPAALTERLNEGDVWMARLTDMLIRAKAMKDYARTAILRDNEDMLSKMTATVSNRIISTGLVEFSITVERLEQLYQTLSAICRDLVTQISFIKRQMEMH